VTAVLVLLGTLIAAAGSWALATMPTDQPGAVAGKLDPPKDANADKAKEWELGVIAKVQLYEVDDAFYQNLAKAKRLSLQELDDLERKFLDAPKHKQPEVDSWFKQLEKQKLLVELKDIKLDIGKGGTLVSFTKPIKCLPSPEQLRKGDESPQTIAEGVTLLAQAHVSSDRRYVRAKLTETSVDFEGSDKVKVFFPDTGKDAIAEVPFMKESRHTQMRDIPDGSSFLLPLQYRPRDARDRSRWMVVLITPRIYIAEEERERRR
jgi:hypothetical protein